MNNTLFLVSVCFLLLNACNKNDSNDQLNKLLILPNNDEIMVPADFELETRAAHDSDFGKIKSTRDSTFTLFYDIGLLASEYVDQESNSKIKAESVNETFFYDKVDRNYLSDPNCCYFITFRETGPANFITLDNQDFDLILDIMKTYKSN